MLSAFPGRIAKQGVGERSHKLANISLDVSYAIGAERRTRLLSII